MCLAQGHNTVTPARLEPAAPRSRVKDSTTEPLRSLLLSLNGSIVPVIETRITAVYNSALSLPICVLKMLSAYYLCCKYFKTLQTTYSMEANIMNSDQTADLGPYCLICMLQKCIIR